MDDEAALRETLRETLSASAFPVDDQMDLLPALPDGPMTRIEVGGERYTAMELATELGDRLSFPYEDRAALVDDVVAAAVAEGLV